MKFLLSLAVALAMTGCATWSTSSIDTRASDANNTTTAATAAARAKTPVDVITVTEGDIVDKRYVFLGDITVNVNKTTVFHPSPTPALVNDRLKEKAHELGADAVIFARYGKGGVSLMSWGSLEGKGRAVRYVK